MVSNRTRLSVGLAALAAAGVLVVGTPAAAQERGSLIRDTEIENTIRAYALPLISAAALDPQAVRFYILGSPALNAFVAGGQNVFVTTTLIRRADHAGQVIGVLAHEIGHIAGGHLAQLDSAIRDASLQAIVTQVLAAGAAVLSRDPGAAVVLGGGANQMITRSLLRFNRTQEQAADQAGIRFLDTARFSSRGLLEFMEILGEQDIISAQRQDPYAITHPLTRERINFLRNHIEGSPHSNAPIARELNERHRRMTAKLDGFLLHPQQTLRNYKESDTSVPARYARAIALYRVPRLDEALQAIDGLIAEAPNDPYFHELKGQMLFENGRIGDALAPYERSVALLPESALLRLGLAHVQIELNQPEFDAAALVHLKQALNYERTLVLAWRLAAAGHGRAGDIAHSALALAEYNLLTGRVEDARGQALRAKRLLKEGSAGWLRAEDILNLTQPAQRRQ